MSKTGAFADAVLAAAKKAAANRKKAQGLLSDEERALLAERYPETGAPVLQIDEKKGKEFLGKQRTDLEERLMRARDLYRKDMAESGYEPMFPVEARYYANPANHPVRGDTQIDAAAKSEKGKIKKAEEADTPEARQALRDAYNRAKDKPLAQKWYAMGQLEDAYIRELGPELGPQRFREDFADPMAATTGGSDPTANLLAAHYGNWMREQGLPMQTKAYDLPAPIGGRYISGNAKMYNDVMNEGRGLVASDHPKRHNFSENFLGRLDRATIDEQMSSGMTGGRLKAPTSNGGYAAMENVVIDEASKLGIPAAELQDVAWAGFKGSDGKPMISHYNDAIERTSRVTGLPKEEVLRRVIRRQMPLYGGAGATIGAGYLGQDDPTVY